MTETGGLVSLLLAGFGGLWLYFRATNEARLSDLRQQYTERLADRDRQIEELKADNAALEAKVEKLTDVVTRNTVALSQNASAQEAVVTMLTDLLGPASPTSSGTPPR